MALLVARHRSAAGFAVLNDSRSENMAWDLALPLLIMLATGIVGLLIVYCARKLMFDPRAADHTDDTAAEAGD